MKKVILGLLALVFTAQAYSQIIKTEELSEVVVVATNYKYLNNVDSWETASIPVELLQRKVAGFNLKDSEYYDDDYDLYHISFFIPQGKILAAYDKDGKILRTIERYNNIKLPMAVKESIADKYPKWIITKDAYLVNYTDSKGAKKTYKLKLENGGETIRIKIDEYGNFL